MLGVLRLLMAGNALRAASLLPKLASSMVMIVIMSVVTGIVLSALILAGFYTLYTVLMACGLSQSIAALVTMGTMLVLLVICILVLRFSLRKVQRLSHTVAEQGNPLATQVTELVKAFVNGVSTPPSR